MANPVTDIVQYAARRLLIKSTEQNAKSSFVPSGLWPLLGTSVHAGMRGRSQDLTQSKWGAAAAYSLIEPVYRSTMLRAQAIDSLPWQFIQESTGEIITTSEDTKPQLSITRAMRCVRREMSSGFFFLWEVSLCLYGNVYFELARNVNRYVSGLEWLNPLGVTIQESGGRVQRYHYSSGSGAQSFSPHEIAHDRMFNPNDDFDGYSPTLVAINKANVELSTSKSWNAFFRNNAIPGGIAAPKAGEQLEKDDLTLLGKTWETLFKGSLNSWRFGILPVPLDIVTFDQPDFEKQVSLSTATTNSIYRTFGVPMALAGDTGTGGLNKENTDETGQNFFVTTLRPESEAISRAFNDLIVPKFPDMEDVRFEFDYSPFEQVGTAEKNRAETITSQVNLGTLSLLKAQEQLGIEPDDRLEGIYVFGGVPIHIDEVVKVAGAAEENEEELTFAVDDGNGANGSQPDNGQLLDAPENIEAEGLNGAQIQAALTILDNMNRGLTVPDVSIELLIALGLKPEQAKRIVTSQVPLIGNAPEDDTKAEEVIGEQTQDGLAILDYVAERYAKIKRELAAWQKFTSKSRDREFACEHSRGEYADIISDDPSRANFDKAFDKLSDSMKAIANTRSKFIKDFDALLQRAAKGSITRRAWSSAVRSLIALASANALSDGLRDAGVAGSLADEEFNDEFDKVERIVKQQSTFVTQLGQKVYTGKLSDGELVGKGLMWWSKSISPAYSEGIVAGKANQMMEFVGKDGKDGCITCKRLKGQRHRAKDWKRKQLWPQKDTDNFVCTGRKCNHNLKPVSARSRGNWLRDAPGKWV